MTLSKPTRRQNFNSIKVRLNLNAKELIKDGYKYFNSIKVRLNLDGKQITKERVIFQFHKGTIKPSQCYKDCYEVSHFNSIKVRLNPVKSKAYKPRRLYRFAGAKIQKKLQKNVDA